MLKRHRALAGSFFNRHGSLPRGTYRRCGCKVPAAGEVDKAQEEYKAALAIQPDLTEVALELAEISLTQGRFEEALKLYRQILERSPSHFPSLFGAALCYRALQDNDHGIEYFRLAADADPNDAASRYGLGAALMQ